MAKLHATNFVLFVSEKELKRQKSEKIETRNLKRDLECVLFDGIKFVSEKELERIEELEQGKEEDEKIRKGNIKRNLECVLLDRIK